MRRMTALIPAIVVLFSTSLTRAEVLHDTLFIVGEQREDNAIADTIGGYLVWGQVVDMQVCDDFQVPDPGYFVDTLTADYIGYVGNEPADGVLIEVFEDLGGYPAESPYWSYQATGDELYVDIYSHYWGGTGYRITTTLPSETLSLPPGNWFVSQVPVDTTESADGYFHFREYIIHYGEDSYLRDSGIDHGSDRVGFYGSNDWTASANVQGYGPGESSFQVTGHPAAPPDSRGDLNCDGGVDFNDIDAFVVALISQSDYESQYPECAYLNGDINSDGTVDFNDIDGFVVCIINGGCP